VITGKFLRFVRPEGKYRMLHGILILCTSEERRLW
jgi:hypothetical protein